MNATKDEIKSATGLLISIAQVIREAKQIPSGHLYSHLMGKMDLNTYQSLIGALKRAGVVKEQNHLLIWTGGE